MSNAMLAAIKNKRKGAMAEGDHQDATHMSQHADDKQKDLHGLVASLSDDEKGKLKQILNSGSEQATKVQKGEASSEEQGKIEAQMHAENAENEAAEHDDALKHGDVDSDGIQKSMLDSKYMSPDMHNMKPRNLGERAKMYAAKNLKAKGKI